MRTLHNRTLTIVVAVLAGGLLACAGAQDVGAEDGDGAAVIAATKQEADVSCEMTFTMKGWSAIVTKAEGEGVVTCDNGQTAEVTLEVDGAGLTAGKTEIDEGKGVFSDVKDISEIFGAYAQAEANAGAVEAVSAQALTKGEVSLAITTEGRGWSLGVSGAKFNIERADDTDNSGIDA